MGGIAHDASHRLTVGTPDTGKSFTCFSRHNFTKKGPWDLKLIYLYKVASGNST
jgi:hypothetical protein